jgi:hypothetical protein
MVVTRSGLAAFAATTSHPPVFPKLDRYHVGGFTLPDGVEIDLPINKTLERVRLIE